MAAPFGVAVLETEIMQRVQLAEAGTLGKTIFEHAPGSAAAREIEALTTEIERLYGQQEFQVGSDAAKATD